MVDQKDGVIMMPRTLSRVGICELQESLAVLAKYRQRARRAAAAKEWASSSAGKAQALKAENEVARAKFEAMNKPPKTKPSEPYPGTREEFFGDKKKKPAEKAGAGWDLKGKARTLAGYSLLGLGYGAHLAGGSGEPQYESAGIVARCKLREQGCLMETPRYMKEFTKLSPKGRKKIWKAVIPEGKTRSLPNAQLGFGTEKNVHASVTGRHGDSATAVFKGDKDKSPEDWRSKFEGKTLKQKYADMKWLEQKGLGPKMLGEHKRGYVMERMRPPTGKNLPALRKLSRKLAGSSNIYTPRIKGAEGQGFARINTGGKQNALLVDVGIQTQSPKLAPYSHNVLISKRGHARISDPIIYKESRVIQDIVARCKLRENGRVKESWIYGKSDPKYATEAMDVLKRGEEALPRSVLMKQERGIPAGGASVHALKLRDLRRKFMDERGPQELANRIGGIKKRRFFTSKTFPKLKTALRSVL
jgi:hypothetical protein